MTTRKLDKDNTAEEAWEEPGPCVSPPCYQHEIDPLYQGIPETGVTLTEDISSPVKKKKRLDE